MTFTHEHARKAVKRNNGSVYLGPKTLAITHPQSDLEISVELSRDDHIKLATRHLEFARELEAQDDNQQR